MILLLLVPVCLNAQTITGTVYQENTDSVIARATVYLNGSQSATITDQMGRFKLKTIESNTPLIVSCVGFFSTMVTNYAANDTLKVYLKPKINALREVVIRNDGMSREEKVRLFSREFLGTSKFAQSCVITNIDEIDLAYSPKKKTLRAYCSNPIHIQNRELGYELDYYLQDFIKSPASTQFSGTYVFSDKAQGADSAAIIANRARAYTGSRMAFVRSLWSNTLDKSGFKILTPFYEPLPADSIVKENEQSEKIVNIKQRLLIAHRNKPGKYTYITQLKPNAFISERGFYDTSFQWSGFMTTERVGDLLPFEYELPAGSVSRALLNNTQLQPETEAARYTSSNKQVDSLSAKQILSALHLSQNIILSSKSPADRSMIIKKWHLPIRYCVLGSFRQVDSSKIDKIFHNLALLTGLEITKTDQSSSANFLILSGGNADRYTETLSAEAIRYLKRENGDGLYYLLSENGFSYLALTVAIPRTASEKEAYSILKRRIIKGFGFFGTQLDNENSLFYGYANLLNDTISSYDTTIITTLYHSAVKSGMTGSDLKAALLSTAK